MVNNRLSEIFFEKSADKPKVVAHTYVKRYEYKSEKEKEMIEIESKKLKFVYKNKEYTPINSLT